MHDGIHALDGRFQSRHIHDITARELDSCRLEEIETAGRAHQATHGEAMRLQGLHDMAPHKSGSARDEDFLHQKGRSGIGLLVNRTIVALGPAGDNPYSLSHQFEFVERLVNLLEGVRGH